jgi:MFS family permease
VLGSFYWLNWATQLPGGILAAKYGTKLIFGWANFIPVLLCFITPLATYLDYRFLVAIRIISGATSGDFKINF